MTKRWLMCDDVSCHEAALMKFVGWDPLLRAPGLLLLLLKGLTVRQTDSGGGVRRDELLLLLLLPPSLLPHRRHCNAVVKLPGHVCRAGNCSAAVLQRGSKRQGE